MSDSLKKTSNSLIFGEQPKWFAQSLIFGEQPEWFAHSCSIVMSDLSNLLTSLFKKREWVNGSFLKSLQKQLLKIVHIIWFYLNCCDQITRFLWAKEQMSNSIYKVWQYASNTLHLDFSLIQLNKYALYKDWQNESQTLHLDYSLIQLNKIICFR